MQFKVLEQQAPRLAFPLAGSNILVVVRLPHCPLLVTFTRRVVFRRFYSLLNSNLVHAYSVS